MNLTLIWAVDEVLSIVLFSRDTINNIESREKADKQIFKIYIINFFHFSQSRNINRKQPALE